MKPGRHTHCEQATGKPLTCLRSIIAAMRAAYSPAPKSESRKSTKRCRILRGQGSSTKGEPKNVFHIAPKKKKKKKKKKASGTDPAKRYDGVRTQTHILPRRAAPCKRENGQHPKGKARRRCRQTSNINHETKKARGSKNEGVSRPARPTWPALSPLVPTQTIIPASRRAQVRARQALEDQNGQTHPDGDILPPRLAPIPSCT